MLAVRRMCSLQGSGVRVRQVRAQYRLELRSRQDRAQYRLEVRFRQVNAQYRLEKSFLILS